MTHVAKLTQTSLILCVVLGSACSQILSIEEAYVDSTLTGGQGGSAQSGTSGGPTAGTGGSEAPNEGGNGGTHHPGNGTSGESGTIATAGTTSNTTGGAPPDGPGLCEEYCDLVTTNCKGKYEQYRTFDQCVTVCKNLPPGEPGDENTNTVSCRLNQAREATNEDFLYCKSAGPLGEGKCGSNCISYCELMQTACTPETTEGNLEPSYFSSVQDCLAACGAMPATTDGPKYYSSSATADPSSFVGNSVFCRAYHLAAGLEHDTLDEHCPHAMGGDPCIE